MAYFSGSNGSMLVDGVKAAGISNWSISSNLGTLDTTTLEDTDRTTIPGVRSTSGSCTLFYYQPRAGSNDGNTASELMRKVMKGRTVGSVAGQAAEAEKVQFVLRIDDGTAAQRHITVDAYITSAQMQMSVGEVLAAAISFEVIGAPLEVAA